MAVSHVCMTWGTMSSFDPDNRVLVSAH